MGNERNSEPNGAINKDVLTPLLNRTALGRLTDLLDSKMVGPWCFLISRQAIHCLIYSQGFTMLIEEKRIFNE